MKTILSITALFLSLGISAMAASALQIFAEDASPAIQVHNGDSDETLTVVIQTAGAGAANTFTIGSTASTLDGSGATDTVAEWVALIDSYANSDGRAVLTADSSLSLGTDSTDGELASGTYTAAPGQWLTIPWDTSVALLWDNGFRANSSPSTVTPRYTLDHVYGSIGGTGATTIEVYVDGNLIYSDATLGTGEPQALNVDLNIPVLPSQACFVRVKRATTATTGSLAVNATSNDP